ncbi:Thaumatin-like protein 1 [Vitis vinifera]|uniref:Thaumatin-like protein 1 n=1 Tax=Vitis vinifera TaxID=29760 RepID=A0A438IJ27_VITVI|nr:Thaumatin-like protein 1 [Vitis vinifera]
MGRLSCCSSIFILNISLMAFSTGVLGATFTFVNRCEYTVWPGILANAGSARLDSTGFELPKDTSPLTDLGWVLASLATVGRGPSNATAPCCPAGDTGGVHSRTGGQDFYDVSLVDGYNLPMIVEGSGGSGMCASTGCTVDLNQGCPAELKVGDGSACRSACEAFGSPEYCCSGAYSTPATCRPSVYSEMFKSACPRSYSYAYDDATSTFTCAGADYTVTFCPSSPSQKSSRDSSPTTTGTPTDETGVSGSGTYEQGVSGSGTYEPGVSGSGTMGSMTIAQGQAQTLEQC